MGEDVRNEAPGAQRLYSSGELAKLCRVTIRTVQYYDARGLLSPSEYSEGGRRLYTEGDASKLRLICALREMGFGLDSVAQILRDEGSELLATLFDERERELLRERGEVDERLAMLHEARRAIALGGDASPALLAVLPRLLGDKRKLWRLRLRMLLGGLVMDLLWIPSLIYAILSGNFLPFALCGALAVGIGVLISVAYFRSVDYICPACRAVFQSSLRESFFAYHTPATRRLTCPSCGRRSDCVETYRRKNGGES